MAQLSVEEVKKVAKLARLVLSETEANQYRGQLERVLDYIGELKKVGTKGVLPTSQVTGLENVFRPDEILSCEIPQAQLLANAAQVEDGYIKVPSILEK